MGADPGRSSRPRPTVRLGSSYRDLASWCDGACARGRNGCSTCAARLCRAVLDICRAVSSQLDLGRGPWSSCASGAVAAAAGAFGGAGVPVFVAGNAVFLHRHAELSATTRPAPMTPLIDALVAEERRCLPRLPSPLPSTPINFDVASWCHPRRAR